MEVQVLDRLEENQTRRRGSLAKILTAVFAVGFIVSVLATFSAFAAANLFKIQNAELSELSATAEGSIVSFDETGIISNVTFHKLNDSATYTITLKNTDDKSHVIENITDDNENPYVVYDYDTHAGEQINAGSDLVFVVTARYANAVTDVNERAQATNVKFLIEFTDIEEEVPLVPDTGANTAAGGYLRFSVISLVISAVGLTIIGLVAIKKHQKAGRFIIVGLIAIAAVTTTAIVRAATIEINSFTIKTNFSLKDRLVVTWTDVNGNEHEEVVSYDEPANIEDQGKEGYTFTGWVDEDGNPVDPTQPITEDMKIHPTFRANKYSIKFHGNGATGGEMTDLTMTFDEAKALTANAFTWAGHEYTGWDTTTNGSGAHYDDQAEVKNLATSDNAVIDLYAQWSVNPFHINYDSNGATSGEMATTNCEYDQTCTLRENTFKKTGYDFKGWTYDGTDYADKADVTNIIDNGTITMSAKWEAHVYSIEYTGLTTEEATYLRAQGNPDTYTIETSSFTLIKPADRLDADGDTREHCVGWRDISVYEDITLPIADALGDKKYEAAWQTVALPEYSITYDYNGGTVATENPTKHNKEQSFTLNEPAKEGYTFTGWTGTTIEGSAPIRPYTLPNPHARSDLEFTAHYRQNNYTIVFHGNGATSGSTASMNMKYDESQNLTTNGFINTGHTFTGWNTQADGQGGNYTDGQEVINLTAEDGATIDLYAKWSPIHYTIDFNGNGATEGSMSYIPAEYNEEISLPTSSFTRTGYTQNGWKNGAEPVADQATVKNLTAEDGATVTLTANWEANKFTVVYHANSDAVSNPTAMNSQIVTYDEAATLTPNAYERDHYKFMGWATSENGAKIYDDGADIMNAVSEDNGILNLYAVWLERTAMFTIGITVNNALKELNSNAATFTHYMAGIPNFEIIDGEQDIATSTSNFPIWSWADGDTIYWWSEAEKPSLNPDSLQMFNASNYVTISLADINTSTATNLTNFMSSNKNLRNIDFGDGDFTNVTTMRSAFSAIGNNYTTEKLTIDLSSIKTSNKLTDTSRLFAESYYVGKIIFSDKFETSGVTNFAEMFRGCGSLSEIIGVEDFDTTSAIYLNGMFWNNKITSLDLTGWNTSNVTTIQQIFRGCSALATLNVSNWDVRKVTNMQDAFPLPQVTTLDLSQWQNSVVTNMDTMFAGASKLTEIDLSGIDTSHIASWGTSNSNIFNSTSKLETIYVSDKFIVNSDAYGWFFNDNKLEGGAGTKNNVSNEGWYGTFARIDDPDNNAPGYFTMKNARYIRYHDNDGDDTNDEANYALMPSYYVSTTSANTLRANAFVRDHYKFMGWATSTDGEVVYADGATLDGLVASKTPLELYAVWKERSAVLDTGPNVNAVLRSFAEEPQSFSHFNGTPDFETIQNEQNIALTSSNFPVYAWYDEANQAIYWWSEAERPQLNTASAKLFSGTHTENNASVNNSLQNLKSIDLTGLDASNALYMDSMFANTTSLESLNLDDFDSSSAVDMRSMLYGTNLANIDLSQIESQNVTNMSYMFSNSKFGSIDASKLNTQSVTQMSGMFRNAAATTIKFFDDDPTDSLFDTSKVTEMASMFYGVHVEELDLRNFNTERVLNFNSMFLYADPIKKLDVTSFNTSNATNMGYMFDQLKNLEELDVTGFNTSKVTNMSNMFNSCAKLTELNLTNFDTSKVTIMDGMFAGLKNMEVLDLSSFDTGKVTTMYYYFVETNKLKTVYISDLWSTDALSSHGGTFFQSQSTITGGAGTRMAQNSTSDIYARIDDPDNNGEKGMFTYKNARYIRYYDNDGNDTNNEANYDLMPSHYITTDSNNPYALATALSENKFERPGYRFLGWATSADGEKLYDDKATISTSASKDPLILYAVWYKLEATLDTGANVNTILKNLATEPTAFEHYAAGTPNFDVIDGEQDIALPSSDVPVYAWYDAESTKIYWWSEAAKPKMNTDSSSFFAGMSSVTSIDFEGLDASNATNMSHMFRGTGLTDIDFSKLESQNVTDMSYMFYGIKKTNTLDVSKLNTSSVRNMASMFEGASFTLISFFDTLNPSASKFKTNEVTSMHYMFKDSTKLTSLDLSSFNTSNVKDFSGTFYGATGLKTLNLDGWDTGNATTMYIMFNNAPSLTRLDLSHFDTKNVTTMQQMFEGCFDLEYLNVSGWSNEKVGNMSYMFHKVGNYKNGVEIILTGFKTPAVTTMAYMFTRDVTELETLDLSSFDTSNVTSMSSMFGGGSQGNGTFYNAKIKTVYASDKFVTTKVDPESNVFNNTSVIVGGAGTTWSQKTAVFARIDDPDNGNPGYFTMKGARYIRYHDNDGDDTNDEANYALMTSHYLTNTGSLKVNAFTNGSKTFIGWNTAADGSGDPYTDGQTMTELTESKTPLELYAQWEQTVQLVTFDDAYSAAGKTKVNNYYTMQDMDSSICNAVTTPVNTDNSDAMTTQLLDTRNNKVYDVGKLVDGRCWLLDNLSLDLTDADVQDNLTEDTTNASNTTLGYLKNGGGGGADQYAMSGATIWTTSYNYSIPYIITAYSDTTGSGGYDAGKYGVYYTYCAATAGSYCYGGSPNYYNYGNASGDATEDICPKGWRLPTSGNSGETNAVSLAYNSDRTSVINALHTPFSGDVVYGYDNSSGQQKINLYQGTAAHFWSSTFGDSTYMRSFAIGETELIPSSSHYRTNATSVRCIAK